jgi:hypothetical protein
MSPAIPRRPRSPGSGAARPSAATNPNAAPVAARSQSACFIAEASPSPRRRALRPPACCVPSRARACAQQGSCANREGEGTQASSLPPRQPFADHRRHLHKDRSCSCRARPGWRGPSGGRARGGRRREAPMARARRGGEKSASSVTGALPLVEGGVVLTGQACPSSPRRRGVVSACATPRLAGLQRAPLRRSARHFPGRRSGAAPASSARSASRLRTTSPVRDRDAAIAGSPAPWPDAAPRSRRTRSPP